MMPIDDRTTTDDNLSCYTTALVGSLRWIDPRAATRAADAVRLAVRTDLPDGVGFSQHTRFDAVTRLDRFDQATPAQLGYAAADRPDDALAGVRAELWAVGAVLVVANTAALPWSPAYGRAGTPHWLLVTDERQDGFDVADPFAARLPLGEQRPFAGRVPAGELVSWMRLPDDLPAHIARRDELALGTAVPVPPGAWRWLRRGPVDVPNFDPGPGTWIHGTAASLYWLAGRLADDPVVLDQCTDDLWAAARHHAARLDWLRQIGRVPAEQADDVLNAWGELPRTLRFAADSARRGRPRPAMVSGSLRRLADLTQRLELTAYPSSIGSVMPGRAHV